MIRFVPSSVADDLSQKLWCLVSNDPNATTRRMFHVVTDLHGSDWLIVDTSYAANAHQEAVLDGIADILQPWIDAGHLPADTNTELAALVESLRGQRFVVYDAFPQLFKDMSKTRQEMIAAGLLAEPKMQP